MLNEPPETLDWLRDLNGEQAENALAQLFTYYRPRLRQLVKRRMHNRLAPRVDPSDVIQDVFLIARKQVPRYLRRPLVAFYVWLHRLTRHYLLNVQRFHFAQRRSVAKEQAMSSSHWDRLAESCLAFAQPPGRNLDKEELKQRVLLALTKLPARDREVLRLRHFENQSNHQVAQSLHLNHDSAATNRYVRALKRLAALLRADEGAEELSP